MSAEHLGFDQIADLADGQLSGAARGEALAHLAACERCSAAVAWLERTLSLMHADAAGPSPALSLDLRALARRRGRPPTIAQIHFDSGLSPRPAGLRSARAVERQLLYVAEPYEIDLRLLPGRADWTLAGQVLGPAAGGSAELLGEGAAASAELSELCEFVLAAVPPGRYLLTLTLADTDLIISDLDLSGTDATH